VNNKSLSSAFLTAILIGGLVLASALRFGTVQASTGDSGIPKPSVPEFSLKVVAYPYDVAPTTTIDPYTGKNITTSYGYHEENKSIEVTIKNQPFVSTLDESGNYTSLYYNVQFKGHYGNEWSYAYSYYNASKSDCTVISIGFEHQTISFPVGGEIDFQVRALIGHQDKMKYDTGALLPDYMRYYDVFVGQTGDWSSTQTIKINENTADATPDTWSSPLPSATPQNTADFSAQSNTQNAVVFGLDWGQLVVLIALIITVIVLAIAVAYLYHKSANAKVETAAGASR